MKGLLCALLLATSTLAAQQQPVDSGPLPRYPKAWIAIGADVGAGTGANLSSGVTIGGRADAAWRFAHRGVLQVQGFAATVSSTAQNGSGTTCLACTSGSTDDLQRVSGASAMLGYLRGSFGTSSMLISAGPAVVQVRGTVGSWTRSAGVEAEVDQTFVEGSRAALTIHVSPVLAPSMRGAAFWWIPVGLSVRFW